MFSRHRRRTIAAVSALALTAGMLQLGGAGLAVAKSGSFSAKAEAKKMDAVKTPKLDWFPCYQTAECVTVKVPRDYNKPKGAKVELALLRVKATNPKKRIGSLFLNPGGPGGTAIDMAYYSSEILSPEVTERFDIVGMDPRGVGSSDNVQCFPGLRQQDPAMAGYNRVFPFTAAEEKAWIKSDKALGKACSKNTLAKSMSSAEVARDLELMRRAVGDKKLSYLGWSYGTVIGQYYANMFPDRFRAVAVDGVIDPVAWAGDKANRAQPLDERLRAADGAWKALREILVRCDKAGGELCEFAPGNPVANLALIAQRLKAHPLTEEDEFTGEVFTFTYADLVGEMLGALYDPAGYEYITDLLSQLIVLTEPPAVLSAKTAAKKTAADKLSDLLRTSEHRSGRPSRGFYYDNYFDVLAAVTCTDSQETTKSASYPAFGVRADQRAPYFGRAWLWSSSVCAGDAFTGNDEDAFLGPFNTKTASPVLFVGDYYDPATNYAGAVSAAKRMPNSGLLRSNSWGHTAYGTSDCATSGVDSYLLTGKLPATNKVCVGDIQPFEADLEELSANTARQHALHSRLPGVAVR
ncbi:MAG: alpha/beta hydrolase [Propionibacteriaceae bacterium]